MTLTTLGRELKGLNFMNNLGLWMIWITWDRDLNQASRFHEELRVMDDMNDSRLWALKFRYYEQHKASDDKNNFDL